MPLRLGPASPWRTAPDIGGRGLTPTQAALAKRSTGAPPPQEQAPVEERAMSVIAEALAKAASQRSAASDAGSVGSGGSTGGEPVVDGPVGQAQGSRAPLRPAPASPAEAEDWEELAEDDALMPGAPTAKTLRMQEEANDDGIAPTRMETDSARRKPGGVHESASLLGALAACLEAPVGPDAAQPLLLVRPCCLRLASRLRRPPSPARSRQVGLALP